MSDTATERYEVKAGGGEGDHRHGARLVGEGHRGCRRPRTLDLLTSKWRSVAEWQDPVG